jgi:hypothetical protein
MLFYIDNFLASAQQARTRLPGMVLGEENFADNPVSSAETLDSSEAATKRGLISESPD